MNRLTPNRLIFLCFAFLACSPSQESAVPPPNVIFIMADDLGYGDLGSYGQQVIQTPHLDQMAAEGLRFTQVYAGSPVCAPSRSTLMTGQHTGHTTVRGNFGQTGVVGLGGGKGRVPLKEEDFTLGELFQQAGYVTGMAGKWGLGEPNTSGHPNQQGFEEFFGFLNQRRAHHYFVEYLWENEEKVMLEENRDGKQGAYAHDLFSEFAYQFVEKHQDRSFFLYLPYTVPHAEYEIPDTMPYTNQPWKWQEKVHAAMVTRLDRDLGQLFEQLERLGIADNTLIFFCSDNGAAERWEGRFDSSGPLRGRKRDLYEGGIRTPMIVRWPGKVPAGTTSTAPWYFPDVLPTLADLLGQALPQAVDGVSVLPTLRGESQPLEDRWFYWEFHERGFQQAVRWRNWKAVLLAPAQPMELYDLSVDSAETTNLAEQHPEIVTKVDSFLQTARTESVDWPL